LEPAEAAAKELRHVQDTPNTHSVAHRQLTIEIVAERTAPASAANAQIRQVVERLPHDAGYSLQFFCECGCGEPVLLTIAEYDALVGGPVYRNGHAGDGYPAAHGGSLGAG
jgi:hypothetical protein